MTEKCVAGCTHYYGGEVRHHENCLFYEESFSKMYADLCNRFKNMVEIRCLMCGEILGRADTRMSALCHNCLIATTENILCNNELLNRFKPKQVKEVE